MAKTALVIGVLMLFQALAPLAHAQSPDPREKCAQEGTELISRIGNPFSFNTHYSKKLGGCFARAAFYEKLKDGTLHGTTYLYNVDDGKIIGFLSFNGSQSSECWVGKAKCTSAAEFDDLIAPYIEL